MLSRKMLSAMEIEAEKVNQIIEGHSETVNALQEEIDKAKKEADRYKAEADKVKGLEKEIETLKKEAETAKKDGAEYDKLKQEFEAYKAEQEKKEQDAIKAEKFRELLKDIGLSDKGIQMALKWQGVDGVELDEDGKITNSKELRKSAKEDWAEYITEQKQEGAETPKPPANNGKKMTIEQIDAIEDDAERQKLMLENKELYGL